MSEQGRDPLIRLPIDQEVFSEVVNSGDVVEDATVATEVISFVRDGEMYELEGAVVFAGYVNKRERTHESDPTSFSVGIEDEAGAVQHVHHRLPFSLRVPISAQSSGVVNVKSRLSGFVLEASGENWLTVRGNLEIHGLLGDEGFYFRCGAQETAESVVAELFEEVVVQEADVPAALEVNSRAANDFEVDEETHAQEVVVEEGDPQVTAEELMVQEAHSEERPSDEEPVQYAELVGAGESLWRHEEAEETEESPADEAVTEAPQHQERDLLNSSLEAVSEAREGHGWAQPSHEDESFRSEEHTNEFARGELANLDRFFVPEPTPKPEVDHDTTSAEKTPIASFEFEHQLDSEYEEQPPASAYELSQVEPDAFRGAESWVPRFSISASVPIEDQDEIGESAPEEAVDDAVSERGEVLSEGVIKNDLWSFVDFNGPEPRHTLRYVIVMEEETLEAVADRCGCTPSELQRVNSWLNGQVEPGHALYIPSTPFSMSKITPVL
jgi:hypothetical protein